MLQMCRRLLGFISHLFSSSTKLKESVLKLVFGSFQGRIDPKEFMQSLQDLGVHISPQHAEKTLKR